jgi:hypothetical protein
MISSAEADRVNFAQTVLRIQPERGNVVAFHLNAWDFRRLAAIGTRRAKHHSNPAEPPNRSRLAIESARLDLWKQPDPLCS